MARIRMLSRPYPATSGVPTIERADLAIFERRYFTHCTQCGFCGDWCCSFGVGVDVPNVERLAERAAPLERFVGVPRERWFADDVQRDHEYPGGEFRRTVVQDGACVFLSRAGRGCQIHAFALAEGTDYHLLKPMICSLFPLTYEENVLCPSEEVTDGELVCMGSGPTLYRGVRAELDHYFGAAFVSELDAIEESLAPA